MAKVTTGAADPLELHENRNKFAQVLSSNPSKLSLKTAEGILGFAPKPFNTSYESINCAGFHPQLEEVTATIFIKRSAGYGGGLCSSGSVEYVRFYLDYGDGIWHDLGYTGVNVHDIPDSKDCDSKLEKPISYTLRLKVSPNHLICKKANLPKLRSVLCWNAIPPANDPDCNSGFPYLWADKKDVRIQVKPLFFTLPNQPWLGTLLEKALINPAITLKALADQVPGGQAALESVKAQLEPPKMELSELIKTYGDLKLDIEPHRSGAKLLDEAVIAHDVQKMKINEDIFVKAGLNWQPAMASLLQLKGNTQYEEVFCAGLDYHNEALVGTLHIKKQAGYLGDLCRKGSKEYISFWIQSDRDCTWKSVGTAYVEVHDLLKDFPREGVSYSVVLPVDLSAYRQTCDKPVVLKLRAVLSWNIPPTSLKPPYWGNTIESYIQVRPGFVGNKPKLITVGGVSTDNIDDTSGLTKPGAKIEINQTGTYANSPFGGIIVVQALCPPFAGTKYRVHVRNLNTNAEYFVNNNLHLLGYDTTTGDILHPNIMADSNNCYIYQDYYHNINSVAALWSPGTNDRLEITLQNMAADGITVLATDKQVIQMDNTLPAILLDIDDQGDCSHYKKGDIIKGSFSVNDAWLLNYGVSSPLGAVVQVSGIPPSGTASGSGTFSINTASAASPCGSVNMFATEKTIHNSVTAGYTVYAQKIVCLR